LNKKTIASMHQLKQDAIHMKMALLRGEVRGFAKILARSWAAKKETASGVATETVERMFNVALDAGAWAGKVSCAGGGGFLMLLTDAENRYQLLNTLDDAGGNASPVKLTFDGAEGWPISRAV
jgi:D-glycero-alpha-D-manno-heptose-7-phosphate kinase